MIFVINALKYDTTKMELITTKCKDIQKFKKSLAFDI